MVRALALLAALGWAGPAAACRLALILALDVSSSVDAREDELQRGGLVAALTAPEVISAFLSNDEPVALSVFEWSGRYNQEVVLDWITITSPADLQRAADVVADSKRSHNEFPTAMGYALGFAAEMFKSAPACRARTIDMAGDGQNNEGFGPKAAYREFPLRDVTVNGLVVNAAEFTSESQLIRYYERQVLKGPTAFLEVAQGFEDYERAMRRKLEREVLPALIGMVHGQVGPG